MAERNRISSPELDNVLSLTLAHLSAVSKRNNEQYILAYIKSQRSFLNQWIVEGQKDVASWSHTAHDSANVHNASLSSQASLNESLGDFAFGSPVLKARVPDLDADISPTNCRGLKTQAPLAKSSRNLGHPSIEKISKSYKRKENQEIPGHRIMNQHDISKKESNKRSPEKEDGSNNEHEDPLAERRHRKKVKRGIMRLETKNDSGEGDTAKGKRTKGQSMAQTNFALMHGFSATNVGKNRLTLGHVLHNTGVFKKGKASNVTKVPKGGKKQEGGYFSESKFLKMKINANLKLCASPPLSSSSSTSSSTSSPKPPKKTRRPKHSKMKICTSLTGQSEISQNSPIVTTKQNEMRKPYDPENSMIWDIEKESRISESDDASGAKPGTVVVKVPQTIGQLQSPVRPSDRNDSTKDVEDFFKFAADRPRNQNVSPDHISMFSLGPSQSASQLGLSASKPISQGRPPIIAETSRYFKPADRTVSGNAFQHTANDSTNSCIDGPTGVDLHIPDAEPRTDYLVTDQGHAPGNTVDIMDVEDLSVMLAGDRHQAEIICAFDKDSCFWSQVAWDTGLQEGCKSVYEASSIDRGDMYMVDIDDALEDYEPVQGFEDQFFKDTLSDDNIYERFTDDFEDRCYSAHRPEEDPETLEFGLQDVLRDCIWPDAYISPIELDSGHGLPHDGYVGDLDEYASQEHLSVTSEYDYDVLFGIDTFYQGRTILYGLNSFSGDTSGSNRLLNTEAEVAGSLKRNHWLPQRF